MSAPTKHSPRTAGVLIPAFSPRRDGDLGIGDTLALREWIDWAAAHRVGFLQLLPINETGADESPYNAISSVALDPLYLAFAPQEVPGIADVDVQVARAELSGVLDRRLVDYPAVRRVKRRLLRLAWERFHDGDFAAEKLEFDGFRAAEADWLEEYTVFRYLMDRAGGRETWDLWPAAFDSPERAREFIANERRHPGATVDRELAFHAFTQWLCFRQWRAVHRYADSRGVKLMGDIPIGISWYSHDVFFRRDIFDLDWCGGAPPERMFKHDRFIQQWGQNWGIPLYRWDTMEHDGFPWWRQRIRKLTEVFHIFRIDHILGFYRIYAFPWRPRRNHEFLDLDEDAARAKAGGRLPQWAWRPDDTPQNKAANLADGDRRLRVIVEAAAGGEVVGEDLGCVPEYVRPHLATLGIASFRIPHWDTHDGDHVFPGSRMPECSFATYATHDHDPLAALWEGCRAAAVDQASDHHARDGAHRTLRLLAEFGGLPVAATHAAWPMYSDAIKWALLDGLLACRSRYAALMVTDLFGMQDRFNMPGTTGGENWRLRVPWTVSRLQADPQLAGQAQRLAEKIAAHHRA